MRAQLCVCFCTQSVVTEDGIFLARGTYIRIIVSYLMYVIYTAIASLRYSPSGRYLKLDIRRGCPIPTTRFRTALDDIFPTPPFSVLAPFLLLCRYRILIIGPGEGLAHNFKSEIFLRYYHRSIRTGTCIPNKENSTNSCCKISGFYAYL